LTSHDENPVEIWSREKMKKIFYGWWIVLATNIICMLGFGTWLYSFGVFFKPMAAEFGWTRAMVSLAYSLRNIEGGIASPIVGWAVDRYGARIVIIIGAIISGGSFCLMPIVDSLWKFYIIYGVLLSAGMSGMLYIPAWTVIAKWFKKRLTRALGILGAGAGFGGFICAPSAAYLISLYGWRAAFVVFGFVIWIVVIPLAFIVKNSPEEIGLRIDGETPEERNQDDIPAETAVNGSKTPAPTEVDFTLKQALASSTFWMLCLAFFFQGVSHSTVTVHLVPFLTDVGISPIKAAASIGSLTLVSVIGRIGFGFLGDYFSKRYLFIVTYVFMGVGMIVLMFTKTMDMVYLFIFLFGVGFGGNVPLMPAIRAEYFGRLSLGKIQGFMNPVMMLAGAIGPPVAGYVFDNSGSYYYSFMVTGVLTFFAAVAMFFTRPTVPKQLGVRS
jgi:MFS family permease